MVQDDLLPTRVLVNPETCLAQEVPQSLGTRTIQFEGDSAREKVASGQAPLRGGGTEREGAEAGRAGGAFPTEQEDPASRHPTLHDSSIDTLLSCLSTKGCCREVPGRALVAELSGLASPDSFSGAAPPPPGLLTVPA